MSYSHDQEFTYAFLLNTTTYSPPTCFETRPAPKFDCNGSTIWKTRRWSVSEPWSKLTLNIALEAVEKQKEFSGAAAEEFARIFKTQTAKFVDAVEAREKKRKTLLPQLPLPLKKSKLRSFPSENGMVRKMTGTEQQLQLRQTKQERVVKQKTSWN